MSSKNSKNEHIKKSNKSKNESQTNSENLSNSQINDIKQSDSISFSSNLNFIKEEENIKNLEEIKKNFKIEKDYKIEFNSILKFLEEEEEKDEINEAVETKNIELKLDNEPFELKAKKIFSEVYGLKEKILYPYFCKKYTWNKSSYIIKLYYYEVEIQINGKKSTSFVFLDDKEVYLSHFEGMPMIFQKEKGVINNVTIISKDFKNCLDFQVIKENKIFQTSFMYADMCNELLEIKGKVNEMKNKIDSLSDLDTCKNEKKELEDLLKLYEQKLYLIQKKYSKERLYYELVKKREKLELLELNIKLGEVRDINNEQKNLIKKEIEKLYNLLSVITIKIQNLNIEFDGFYISNKTINLENTLGDKLEIPPKSPIIVEISNYYKYSDIIDSLQKKKKILESIGFQKDCFYFVGILKNLDLNDKIKEEIKLIKENSELTNMIVIYPENTKFLNVPLYETKEESKEVNLKKGILDDLTKELKEIIPKILDEKFKIFENILKKELKEEILPLIKK